MRKYLGCIAVLLSIAGLIECVQEPIRVECESCSDMDTGSKVSSSSSSSAIQDDTDKKTGCKGQASDNILTNSVSVAAQAAGLTNQSGVIFTYDGISVLTVTHINAVYNCCPERIAGTVGFSGSLVSIYEQVIMQQDCSTGTCYNIACACECPYDIQYVITGISPGVYQLQLVSGGSTRAFFTVDLLSDDFGEYYYSDCWPCGW